MRINDTAMAHEPRVVLRERRPPTAAASSPSAGVTRVGVSGSAKERASRMARVESLRAAIANGALAIDSGAIAEKLVGEDA